MPSKLEYTLIYFNGRGLAELPRLLFKYAGVEFVDTRMSGREEFVEKYKPVLPTGKVPCLEIKDESGNVRKFPESAAIVRYLAREFGLYGKDNIEALQVDGVLEVLNDLLKPMYPIFGENDEAKKEELKKKAREEQLPPTLKILEGFVADGAAVFVGSSITVADIALYRAAELVMGRVDCPTLLDGYPKLKAINDKVTNEPKIAEWVSKRPDTPW